MNNTRTLCTLCTRRTYCRIVTDGFTRLARARTLNVAVTAPTPSEAVRITVTVTVTLRLANRTANRSARLIENRMLKSA